MLFIYSIIPFLQIPTIVDNSKEYNKDKLSTFGITIAINKLCRADIWFVVADIMRRKGTLINYPQKRQYSQYSCITKRITNKEEGEERNDYRNPKRN
jgi:hypothetical protein